MSQIVAGLYEIDKQIGAGGGGVVYLGHHIRLDKKIVLKADKRKLSVGKEILRREVDLLKDLTQTYIPQVYDFVQEGDTVYTVMDFIEGESLDKFLGRGEKIPQRQVIKWACQLLEALKYLHEQPPHGILHGDIKPANIMIRTNGDICLIDYNIALALGEDGAVKVGFSRGYASPEHYGEDYIQSNKAAAVGNVFSFQNDKTEVENYTEIDDETDVYNDETEVDDVVEANRRISVIQKNKEICNRGSESKSTTNGSKGILLDVRSDIYSLGATLYHLLSGRRPAQDAREVVPLCENECSPAVAAIIQKSMAPNPNERYQTAQEMLQAFILLHTTDNRVLRHKARIKGMRVAVVTIFLMGGAFTFTGLKQIEQHQEALVLAEYSSNALNEGNVNEAIKQALLAIPNGKSIFDAPVTAESQLALTNALGVYDLEDGYKALDQIILSSAPFDFAVSPTGKYVAVVYAYETIVFDTATQKKIISFPIQESALSDVAFIGEEKLVYAGTDGLTAYNLEKQEKIWTGNIATTITVSEDKKVVAAVNRKESKAFLYQSEDGTIIAECDFENKQMSVPVNDTFADPENNIFVLNTDGSMLAVSFSNGELYIFNIIDPNETLIIYEDSEYKQFSGGFHEKYFVFSAKKDNESLLGLIDVQTGIYLGDMISQDAYLVQADENGIYVANRNLLVQLEPKTMEEKELAYAEDVQITAFSVGKEHALIATEDGGIAFYDNGANLLLKKIVTENSDFLKLEGDYAVVGNKTENTLRIFKLENYEETQLLNYDARYQHDEARVSHDRKTVMLFDYQSFRIYDMSGELIIEETFPNAELIYDQQYRKTKDNSYLEVIWYDGMVRYYSAVDGCVFMEELREPPKKDLYEEFYTNDYRIESPLHGVPEVYDIKSGELLATLETDAYLTYVTQMDDYLVTEYVSAEGERYAVLLDKNFQKVAFLPNLCDVMEDGFVFDYNSGNLRESKKYSLEELIEMGEAWLFQ